MEISMETWIKREFRIFIKWDWLWRNKNTERKASGNGHLEWFRYTLDANIMLYVQVWSRQQVLISTNTKMPISMFFLFVTEFWVHLWKAYCWIRCRSWNSAFAINCFLKSPVNKCLSLYNYSACRTWEKQRTTNITRVLMRTLLLAYSSTNIKILYFNMSHSLSSTETVKAW